MFKKKEVLGKGNNDIPARYVKKGGVLKDTEYNRQIYENVISDSSKYGGESKLIPAKDISESYLSKRQFNEQSNPSNTGKGARKIFTPSFLLRRKKNQASNNKNEYQNIDEFDESDIACYDDLVAEQKGIHPVILGQLDDSQINTIELDQYEKFYRNRLDFVLNNYRKPPPYPGDKPGKHKHQNRTKLKNQKNIDTPLMRQLLNDKQINDNASMNNFWQASPNKFNLSHKCLPVETTSLQISDRLVNRTHDIVTKGVDSENKINILNTGEIHEKRKQYYMNNEFDNVHDREIKENHVLYNRDAVSEIVYPAKDYEIDHGQEVKRISMSASVPNLSQQEQMTPFKESFTLRQPRAHLEPGEMEALIAHYRKTSLDNFEPYGGATSESISLYSEDSHSFVPPSPYLSAEIPEWLQVYAKASSELDEFLKWEMFRYPELDCWQTMLKRLYKKELEQIVLWFEEYRLRLQQEIEERIISGYQPRQGVLRKTEV